MAEPTSGLDAATAARLARIVLAAVHREYPNQIVHLLHDDDDVRPPRRLTPAFYGCFDWHSAVHSHWCLVRLVRLAPDAGWKHDARAALARSLTEENLAAELAHLSAPGRDGFERPYGLAWLMQLATELAEFDDHDANVWSRRIEPLTKLASERFHRWLPRLLHPIRTGEHSQTAFAMGLVLDHAVALRNERLADLLRRRALDFHADDRDAPLRFEPSGHDFLSPSLAVADLMRRVLATSDFSTWLDGFLPGIPRDGATGWLPPVPSPDPGDGKLSHLDGLSLSRAWMLGGIAAALPAEDLRRSSLLATAAEHADSGLDAVSDAPYAGAHWLPSFAAYLLTRRGIDGAARGS